jgi:hypothetical protein
MSLALTAPDYVVSERYGARAMMLHGVIAQSLGKSVLKHLPIELLKLIWTFVKDEESEYSLKFKFFKASFSVSTGSFFASKTDFRTDTNASESAPFLAVTT